jgi:hypothetical protein
MAITRQRFREACHNKSRFLRTRIIPPKATAIRESVQKSQRSKMNCMNGGTQTETSNKNFLGLKNRISRKLVATGTKAYES